SLPITGLVMVMMICSTSARDQVENGVSQLTSGIQSTPSVVKAHCLLQQMAKLPTMRVTGMTARVAWIFTASNFGKMSGPIKLPGLKEKCLIKRLPKDYHLQLS